MRISVVIPAFNNVALTQRCVRTLLAATDAAILAEVVVVDDASTDGVSAAWTAAQPDIVPVLLERNRGFSGACNAGAARCTGAAILFLNNDAFAHRGSVAAMRAALAMDASVGVAGARLLYADGSIQHAGMALLAGGVSAWWHVYKHQPGSLPDAGIARDYLAVTGAALMIRRDLFVGLGGFDEGFVNGWEDVDLCLRAWCAGARVRYEAAAVLDHLESATTGRRTGEAANERRFAERWSGVLAKAPRYPLPAVPPVAFAAPPPAATGFEAWAFAHAERWWKDRLGAAVVRTRPGSRLDRARFELRAVLDRRRPTLEVAWGDACLARATGPRRVAFVAPIDASQSRAYARARQIAGWWTPTAAARDALVAAGVPFERVSVAPLGATSQLPPERSGKPVVGVTRADAPFANELVRRRPEVELVWLAAGEAPDLRAVDIVLAANDDDRWGMLVPAALCGGCHVVTTRTGESPDAPGMTIVEPDDVIAALSAQLASIAEVRAGAAQIQRAARRRFDAALATEHIAELARAAAGGLPPAAAAGVDPAFATRLRGASYGGQRTAPTAGPDAS